MRGQEKKLKLKTFFSHIFLPLIFVAMWEKNCTFFLFLPSGRVARRDMSQPFFAMCGYIVGLVSKTAFMEAYIIKPTVGMWLHLRICHVSFPRSGNPAAQPPFFPPSLPPSVSLSICWSPTSPKKGLTGERNWLSPSSSSDFKKKQGSTGRLKSGRTFYKSHIVPRQK